MKYTIKRVDEKNVLLRHGEPATDPIPSNAELEFWLRIEEMNGLLAEAERLCLEHCPDEMSGELLADWEANQRPPIASLQVSDTRVAGGDSPARRCWQATDGD